jgi:hypothetical protein
MDGRAHFVLAEQLVAEAHGLPVGNARTAQLTAEALVHAVLARAADDPGRRVDHEWCEACDGSGYAHRQAAA